jgi:hypothetical protein
MKLTTVIAAFVAILALAQGAHAREYHATPNHRQALYHQGVYHHAIYRQAVYHHAVYRQAVYHQAIARSIMAAFISIRTGVRPRPRHGALRIKIIGTSAMPHSARAVRKQRGAIAMNPRRRSTRAATTLPLPIDIRRSPAAVSPPRVRRRACPPTEGVSADVRAPGAVGKCANSSAAIQDRNSMSHADGRNGATPVLPASAPSWCGRIMSG